MSFGNTLSYIDNLLSDIGFGLLFLTGIKTKSDLLHQPLGGDTCQWS